MHSALHFGDEQLYINAPTGAKMAAIVRSGLLQLTFYTVRKKLNIHV